MAIGGDCAPRDGVVQCISCVEVKSDDCDRIMMVGIGNISYLLRVSSSVIAVTTWHNPSCNVYS